MRCPLRRHWPPCIHTCPGQRAWLAGFQEWQPQLHKSVSVLVWAPVTCLPWRISDSITIDDRPQASNKCCLHMKELVGNCTENVWLCSRHRVSDGYWITNCQYLWSELPKSSQVTFNNNNDNRKHFHSTVWNKSPILRDLMESMNHTKLLIVTIFQYTKSKMNHNLSEQSKSRNPWRKYNAEPRNHLKGITGIEGKIYMYSTYLYHSTSGKGSPATLHVSRTGAPAFTVCGRRNVGVN